MSYKYNSGADCSICHGNTSGTSMGFIPRPSIHFQNQFKLPSANTCGNQINLPLLKMDYDEFKYYMTFGIINTAGFGQI